MLIFIRWFFNSNYNSTINILGYNSFLLLACQKITWTNFNDLNVVFFPFSSPIWVNLFKPHFESASELIESLLSLLIIEQI